MNRNWLDDVIILNESDDPQTAGDVLVYRSEGDLARHLEDWYVKEVKHLALTGSGDKAILGLKGSSVVVERREPFSAGLSLLHQWLTAIAKHVHSARSDLARKGKVQLGSLEAQGVLPHTIEGLIAYVGFVK
jgi:hypothetical protein